MSHIAYHTKSAPTSSRRDSHKRQGTSLHEGNRLSLTHLIHSHPHLAHVVVLRPWSQLRQKNTNYPFQGVDPKCGGCCTHPVKLTVRADAPSLAAVAYHCHTQSKSNPRTASNIAIMVSLTVVDVSVLVQSTFAIMAITKRVHITQVPLVCIAVTRRRAIAVTPKFTAICFTV